MAYLPPPGPSRLDVNVVPVTRAGRRTMAYRLLASGTAGWVVPRTDGSVLHNSVACH